MLKLNYLSPLHQLRRLLLLLLMPLLLGFGMKKRQRRRRRKAMERNNLSFFTCTSTIERKCDKATNLLIVVIKWNRYVMEFL